MKEELRRRISAALDAPGGLGADRDLSSILDGQPEAARYARDLERIDAALRDWPLPEPSDEAMEALALRIEQRIESGEELPRIPDPTQPPLFDDDELRDATAGLVGGDPPSGGVALELLSGPSITSGEYEMLDRLSEVPEERAAARVPDAVVRGPAKPPEVTPPAEPASVRPPGRLAEPASPAARSLPKLATVAEIKRANDDPDRISFAPPIAPSAPARVTPIRKEAQRVRWMPALAAAAAIGLGILATTSMYEAGAVPSPGQMASEAAPAAAVAPASAAGSTRAGSGGSSLDRLADSEEVSMPMGEPTAPAVTAAPLAPPSATVPVAPMPSPAERSAAIPGATAPRAPVAGFGGAGVGRGGLVDGSDAEGRARRAASATGPGVTLESGGSATARSGSGAPRGTTSSGGASSGAVPGGGGAASHGAASGAAGAPAQREPTARAEAPARDDDSAEGARTEGRSGPATQAPAAAAPADLPVAPSRGEVLAAIQSIEPAVRACAVDQHGTATVRIVVAPTGRVTTATVTGPFAGTPIGSCVARAVRTGRFPPFSGERFEITYPFTL